MTALHEAQIKELRKELGQSPRREQLETLQQLLAERDKQLADALRDAEEANARLVSTHARW